MNLDNALVVEFLAQHNPNLIKQWHNHIGINALKQIAEEYAPIPEVIEPKQPKRPQVDERIVYAFLDMMTARIDEPELLDARAPAQFWERDAKIVKAELFEEWRELKSHIIFDLKMANAFNGVEVDAPNYDDTGLFLVGYDVEVAK
jgi:hypothetical protein